MRYTKDTKVVLLQNSKTCTISSVRSTSYTLAENDYSWNDSKIDHYATALLQISKKITPGYICILLDVVILKQLIENHPQFTFNIITKDEKQYLLHVIEKYKQLP